VNDSATTRRVALRRLAQASAVLGASGLLGVLGLVSPGRFRRRDSGRPLRDHRVPDEAGRPPLVVTRGKDKAKLVQAALASLGGMSRFVRPGEIVLVKPNMAWDRTPEQGADTHPEVVAEVVRQCRGAGAARVVVAENPVHDAAPGSLEP
jgi:hypothetical protein